MQNMWKREQNEKNNIQWMKKMIGIKSVNERRKNEIESKANGTKAVDMRGGVSVKGEGKKGTKR